MKKEQFQEWLKENPVTEWYLQYLKDYAEALDKEQNPYEVPRSLDDLISLGSHITEVNIRRSLLDELLNIEFEDIEHFYQPEETE